MHHASSRTAPRSIATATRTGLAKRRAAAVALMSSTTSRRRQHALCRQDLGAQFAAARLAAQERVPPPVGPAKTLGDPSAIPSLRVDPAHACEDRQTKPRTAWRLSYEQALRSALANGFMTDVTPSPAATAPDPVSIDIVRRPGGQPLAAQRLYRANFSVRWAGPTYSLSGRINSLDAVCSMMCAVHPVIRLITKIGVKEPISNPIKW